MTDEEVVQRWKLKAQASAAKFERSRLRLSAEERDAIKTAIGIVDWQAAYFSQLKQTEPLPSAVLRNLLARLS